MSKVFRFYETQQRDDEKKLIPIRSLQPELEEPISDEEVVDIPTQLRQLEQQREQMLREVEIEIKEQRSQMEHMRQVALDDIHSVRKAWEEEKVELERQAYEEGLQAGREEGVRTAREEWQSAIDEANRIVEHAQQQAQQYVEEQEFVILEMAMKTAERIMNVTLQRDDDVYVELVKRALKEAREMKEIKLYVAPKYYEIVNRSRDELTEMFPPDIPFLIFANDDFEDEECYIETNHGRIVVTIDEQLKLLKEKLTALLESGDA